MTERLLVRSLQELCFTHIVMTLEEYTDEELALLPERFREQLLHSIPVVDVCRLEGTQFTSGIDMNSVWEHLYKYLIDRQFSSATNWREQLFAKMTSTILSDNRPYDFIFEKIGSIVFIGPAYLEDFINYLVAVKCDYRQLGSLWKNGIRRFAQGAKNRHQVTQMRGAVPPGKEYHVCQRGQFIPPRYKMLFAEGSCFLPDSIALELIRDKCQYLPREVTLSMDTFSTFLYVAAHERSSLDNLATFFEEVPYLTILCNENIYSAETFKNSLSKLLGLMLHSYNSKVTALTFQGPTASAVIDSISPTLASLKSYNSKIVIKECGSLFKSGSLTYYMRLDSLAGVDSFRVAAL